MEKNFRNFKMKRLSVFFVFFCIGFNFVFSQTVDRPVRLSQGSSSISYNYQAKDKPPVFRTPSFITQEHLDNELTQYYLERYSSPSGIHYLNGVMERASIYLPFIREEIYKRNLPPELIFLPVIESSFVVTARSRSGAVGLWQFMMNSISPFDMNVNDFVDERRDFLKSTRGALDKLIENYNALGNWELALAAYNAGLGGVRRALRRADVDCYWELSARNELVRETVHYVPKFIATAYILSQPRRFGINVWHEPIEWATIPLERQVSLEILAREAGVDRQLLGHMNSELLRGISPPDRNYLLKVPASHVNEIKAVLEREDLRLIRYFYHVVRQGDTIWSMTRQYNVTQNLIEMHNPGISRRYLRLGETVIIPAFGDVPVNRQTASVSSSGTASSTPNRTSNNNQGQYVVQRGDTLWSLGNRFGIDPMTLAADNDMTINQVLREGRVLKVPIIE